MSIKISVPLCASVIEGRCADLALCASARARETLSPYRNIEVLLILCPLFWHLCHPSGFDGCAHADIQGRCLGGELSMEELMNNRWRR